MHNHRQKKLDYINHELTCQNENFDEYTKAEAVEKVKQTYIEQTRQKWQAKTEPIREAVLRITPETTMADLHRLRDRLEAELGMHIFQISIHRDEGHKDKDTGEWIPNLHAHITAEWTEHRKDATRLTKVKDPKTGKPIKGQFKRVSAYGKTLDLHPADFVKLQDITAEVLGMARGKSSSKKHLDAITYKAEQRKAEVIELERKIEELKQEVKRLDQVK